MSRRRSRRDGSVALAITSASFVLDECVKNSYAKRKKELASSLDISVGHFCRAFKCTFGMSARIWIRQRRIQFAQGLMLTTRASLSEIALSCGMSDQPHFTRSFRRIVGEAPFSWRQTRHGAIEERVTEVAYPGTTKPIT
ncbi:MAG TPA: AraC family transcriptional regulator [Steroidobacteraceae bacterium]|jgi:AraC-like DNA-binding protein